MGNLPDPRIDLDLLRAQDPKELTKVAEVYGPVLKSVFGRIAVDRHHLRDIVQDFWVHVLPRLNRYSGKTPFGPWLVRCATNFRSSRARRDSKAAGRTAEFEENQQLVDDGSTPVDEAQRRLLEGAVARALDRLPDRERQAATLTLMEGYSNVEAARIMGVGPSAVAKLVQRALFKLQDNDILRAFHDDL